MKTNICHIVLYFIFLNPFNVLWVSFFLKIFLLKVYTVRTNKNSQIFILTIILVEDFVCHIFYI